MASSASERLRRQLTADLHAKGVLASTNVEAAFHAVARERFVAEAMGDGGLEAVYRDDAILTKRDAQGMPISSSSQPAIMAKMLELLDVWPGAGVLEIGAGTGYNAALLAHLAGPSGKVTSIDIDQELARRARRALRDAGVSATVVAGDGRQGHPPSAPFDRIIVTASGDEIPRAWLQQLSDGGRLVLPVRLDPERSAIQLIAVLERRGAKLRSVGQTRGRVHAAARRQRRLAPVARHAQRRVQRQRPAHRTCLAQWDRGSASCPPGRRADCWSRCSTGQARHEDRA